MFSDTTLVGHREMGGGHTSQASESCWSGWRQKNTNTKLPPTSLSAGWWFQPPSYEPRTVSFPIRLLLPHSSQRSLGWRTIRASGSPASLPVLQPFLLQSQWDLSKIRVVPLSCLKSSLILLKKKGKLLPGGVGARKVPPDLAVSAATLSGCHAVTASPPATPPSPIGHLGLSQVHPSGTPAYTHLVGKAPRIKYISVSEPQKGSLKWS